MSENLHQKDLNNCNNDNLDGTYTISPGGTKIPSQHYSTAVATATNGRRFVNVDKFLMQRYVTTKHKRIFLNLTLAKV